MMIKRIGRVLLALAGFALLPVAATDRAPDAWRFEAMPYLWGAGMEGDAGVGRLVVSGVEVSFTAA